MRNWNYRVLKTGDIYQIHEVFYDDVGIIIGWSKSPCSPVGDSPAELEHDVEQFRKAFGRPVLRESDDTLVD